MNSHCRICLFQLIPDDGIDIFVTKINNQMVSDMIMHIAPVNVSVDDHLSTVICHRCMTKLQMFFDFRMTIIKSALQPVIKIENLSYTYVPVNTNEQKRNLAEFDHNYSIVSAPLKTTDTSEQEQLVCTECGKIFRYRSRLLAHMPIHTGIMSLKCEICNKGFPTKRNLNVHRQRIHKVKIGMQPKVKLKYECDRCGKSFLRKTHLMAHIITHTGEKPYKCVMCPKAYSFRWKLTRHVMVHQKDKTIGCDKCDKKFRFQANLEKHQRVHDSVKPHICDVCGKGFVYAQTLRIHHRRHTGENPYICEYCSKGFPCQQDLKKHILTHSSDSLPHCSCPVCGRSYSSEGNLRIHIGRTHSRIKPHECKVCRKKFGQASTLKCHYLNLHSGHRPYFCEICDKRFATNRSYASHQRTHCADKSFPCTECDQKFSVKSQLKNHLVKEHSIGTTVYRDAQERNPLPCSTCGRVFGYRRDLERHLETHSGIKRWTCDRCGQRFGTKGTLTTHLLRKHDGTKRFVCDICDKRFILRSGLKLHMKSHNDGQPYYNCTLCPKKFVYRHRLRYHMKSIHGMVDLGGPGNGQNLTAASTNVYEVKAVIDFVDDTTKAVLI